MALADFLIYGDSVILGWVIVDYVANILVSSGATFTRVRFLASRHFAKRDYAILLSFVQVIIAMVVSYYIFDWISSILETFRPYLLSVSLVAAAVLYLYVLAENPYKILTVRRILPALVLLALAIGLYYYPDQASAIATLLGI